MKMLDISQYFPILQMHHKNLKIKYKNINFGVFFYLRKTGKAQ
jgi:hypothetical protein